ncbi:MAG: hypothetical protein Aurels2KO_21490 [Aureliella sp.]
MSSEVVVLPDDFPDNEMTSDHRAVLTNVFRSSFLRTYLSVLLTSLAVAAGSLLFRGGLEADWRGFFVGPAVAIAVAIFFLTLAAVAYFRVYVSVEGLRCYTAMGIYRTIPWSEADSIRPYHLAGLRYLRVGASSSGREVWLPLFLTDMQGFRKAVWGFAGEEHCLSQALKGTEG